MATQSDDFNRASLGTTDPAGGSTYDGQGTWTIVSNQLRCPNTAVGPSDHLVYDTGDASAFISVDLISSSGSTGLCFRWSDTSNFFWARVNNAGGSFTDLVIDKVEAGSSSTLCYWTFSSATLPANIKIRMSGNDFLAFLDDVNLGGPTSGTASSTFNNTATYHGVMAVNAGTLFDNWLEDDDLTVPLADSESFALDDAGTGLEFQPSDTFTFADNQGLALDQSDQSSGDGFRLTESASLSKNGALLLERPLYALIESNVRTAQILDYWEAHPDDETRETGIDVDL